MKVEEKHEAIKLRKAGRTYSEILAQIPVAKSTLSEWFKSVQLATAQKQRLTKKRKEASLRGSLARRNNRLAEIKLFTKEGAADLAHVSDRELWLIGVVLYWAEGSKQYEHSPSAGVTFTNSDSKMVHIFLKWLAYMNVPPSAITFELYIHETRASETSSFKRWWANELGISPTLFNRVYLKKGNPKTKRKNIADLYHGLVRIRVSSSTTLNRRINGWVQGIVASLGGRLMVGRETLNLSI